MHKAILGIGAILEGYYIWVSQNLGNAFWVLLIVLGVNLVASIYTRVSSIRNIPHDLMAYTVSIVGLVYANNHFQLDLQMVKMMIILLLLHELRVSYPVAVSALKKLGVSDQAATSAMQGAISEAEKLGGVDAAAKAVDAGLQDPAKNTTNTHA